MHKLSTRRLQSRASLFLCCCHHKRCSRQYYNVEETSDGTPLHAGIATKKVPNCVCPHHPRTEMWCKVICVQILAFHKQVLFFQNLKQNEITLLTNAPLKGSKKRSNKSSNGLIFSLSSGTMANVCPLLTFTFNWLNNGAPLCRGSGSSTCLNSKLPSTSSFEK